MQSVWLNTLFPLIDLYSIMITHLMTRNLGILLGPVLANLQEHPSSILKMAFHRRKPRIGAMKSNWKSLWPPNNRSTNLMVKLSALLFFTILAVRLFSFQSAKSSPPVVGAPAVNGTKEPILSNVNRAVDVPSIRYITATEP